MEVAYLDMSAVLHHIGTLSKVELLAVRPAPLSASAETLKFFQVLEVGTSV